MANVHVEEHALVKQGQARGEARPHFQVVLGERLRLGWVEEVTPYLLEFYLFKQRVEEYIVENESVVVLFSNDLRELEV